MQLYKKSLSVTGSFTILLVSLAIVAGFASPAQAMADSECLDFADYEAGSEPAGSDNLGTVDVDADQANGDQLTLDNILGAGIDLRITFPEGHDGKLLDSGAPADFAELPAYLAAMNGPSTTGVLRFRPPNLNSGGLGLGQVVFEFFEAGTTTPISVQIDQLLTGGQRKISNGGNSGNVQSNWGVSEVALTNGGSPVVSTLAGNAQAIDSDGGANGITGLGTAPIIELDATDFGDPPRPVNTSAWRADLNSFVVVGAENDSAVRQSAGDARDWTILDWGSPLADTIIWDLYGIGGDNDPQPDPATIDPSTKSANNIISAYLSGICITPPTYDLALQKVLNTTATSLPVEPGDLVTFDITVTNQGQDVQTVDVTDYVQAGFNYDPANNPAGTVVDSGNGESFDYSWGGVAGDTTPVAEITPMGGTEVFAMDETITIPIVLEIDAAFEGTELTNWAEISNFDNDTDNTEDASTGDIGDSDSTPNQTIGDDIQPATYGDPSDDEIDGDGDDTDADDDLVLDDEDDHDVAGVTVTQEDTYSLGNQVWFDENNNGMIDAGEAPIPNVWVELFTDLDGDGQPDDTDNNGVIDVNDAIATTGTDADGLYLFDGLDAGEYIVGIPPMEWDPGQPLDGYLSSDPTSTDANDDIDDNDDGAPGVAGYVLSTAVLLGDGEPLSEDPDNDPTTADANENLTVDFGFYIPSVEDVYSVGNQVWFDENNNGMIDAGETPIPNVWVELFVDIDLDGQPDDLNSDGVIDVNDAIATTGTDADGLYLFDGLAAGSYIVGIPPMEWDPGQPLEGYLSSDPTSSDANDDIDNNDDGAPGVDGYVLSTVVLLGDGEPLGEDPDNDPTTLDLNENLTVDFGFYVPEDTYSLGNQVWFDVNNNGLVDSGEAPIPNVWVELFIDLDGDGQPDDTNGDGVIDETDAVALTGTDANGKYLFDGLAPGDYIVGIPPMEWDPGQPLYGYLSSDSTSTNPNDDIDNDDNGTPGAYGYVWSGPVTLDGNEPTGESPDNDPNTPDGNENLTVDFGFYLPQFDMALIKQLADGTNSASVDSGDSVTFNLTVTNQGDTAGFEPAIVDYVPAGLILNDDDWALADGVASIVLEGVTIAPGESVVVPITFTVDGTVSQIDNLAEIYQVTPVDELGQPIYMPNGSLLPDVDSIADSNPGDDVLVDDATDNSADDEDDHDIASLNVGSLAFTGVSTWTIVLSGLIATLIGAAFVQSKRATRTA